LLNIAITDDDSDVRNATMAKIHHPLLLTTIALLEIQSLAEAEQNYAKMVSMAGSIPVGSRLLTQSEYLDIIKGTSKNSFLILRQSRGALNSVKNCCKVTQNN